MIARDRTTRTVDSPQKSKAMRAAVKLKNTVAYTKLRWRGCQFSSARRVLLQETGKQVGIIFPPESAKSGEEAEKENLPILEAKNSGYLGCGGTFHDYCAATAWAAELKTAAAAGKYIPLRQAAKRAITEKGIRVNNDAVAKKRRNPEFQITCKGRESDHLIRDESAPIP